MNILFFPAWYDSEELPGAGSFFVEQAKALTTAGHKVTVVLADILYYPYKAKTKRFCILEQNRDGIEVYRIKVPSYCTGQIPFLFFKYYQFFYKKLMHLLEKRGYKFDVIYAHSFWHAGYIATRYKKKYNIPLIVQEHRSLVMTGELKKSANKYLKQTVLQADAFFCVSKKLKESVIEKTNVKNKIDILPNMVDDIFTFKELPKKSEFIFAFIGTLDDNKRSYFLLKTFEKFLKTNDNTRLVIAGKGPLKDTIINYISNSEILKSHVDFLGFISRTQVVDLLTRSNAFILPSTYETFGVVYIEAMAIGRPVIATRNKWFLN